MRVLFVNHGPIGTMLGHARVESSLRTGVADLEGVDARFVSVDRSGVTTRALARPLRPGSEAALQPLRWHLAESLRGRQTVRRAVAAARPDAIHLHSQTLGLLLGDVMRRIPTLVSTDTTVADWHALAHPDTATPAGLRPSLALERRAFGAAAAVVAWSAWSSRAVLSSNPAARIETLHPGLDLDRFRPPAERAPGPTRVLFVGGRFEEKGGSRLLRALAPWLGRDCELDVVTMEPPAPTEGVRVHALQGEDPRLLELLRQADLFCLPTRRDAYPWVLLEAMACGTPVVSTAVAAIGDMVAPEAGVLLAPDDDAGLRRTLDELLHDGPRRDRMGTAARSHVERHFDARGSARGLLALLHRIGVGSPGSQPEARDEQQDQARGHARQ